MASYNDICAVVWENNGQILNSSTGNILHDFQDNKTKGINAVAVSENLIVTGGRDGQIYVREISDGYELLRTVNLRDIYNSGFRLLNIVHLTFLSVDIVMVVTFSTGLFFVSVESGICISHFKLQDSKELHRAAALSDGRICAGGPGDYCVIFQPPPESRFLTGRDKTSYFNYSKGNEMPWLTVVHQNLTYPQMLRDCARRGTACSTGTLILRKEFAYIEPDGIVRGDVAAGSGEMCFHSLLGIKTTPMFTALFAIQYWTMSELENVAEYIESHAHESRNSSAELAETWCMNCFGKRPLKVYE